jgi:tight adherence protein C
MGSMFGDLPFTDIWLPIAMLAVAVAVAVPGVLSVWRNAKAKEEVERRLERRGTQFMEPHKHVSPVDNLVLQVSSKVAPTNEEKVSEVRARLALAGLTHSSAVGQYYLARLVCVILPQLALLFMLPYLSNFQSTVPLFISVGLLIVGLVAPSFYVDHLISARQSQCSLGFPDMMDLMVACVEAGLSLDASVQRVGEELELRHPIIAGHMKTLSLELRAGKSRKQAWRSFADRMNLEEAGSLATMLRQAEEMGTSLGATLRIFSADMRQRRILMAEEKAMALPAKLTLPLILFVFPVLLGVLILPAVAKMQGVLF